MRTPSPDPDAATPAPGRADEETRLRHDQRVDALGQIVGGVAHDFNNVVMAVMAGTRTIGKRAENPDEVRRIAGLVEEAAERGAKLIARVLDFARREGGQTDILDVSQALQAVAARLEPVLGPGHRLAVERPERLPIARGDRAEFEAAIAALLLRARDALPGGGTVAVALQEDMVEAPGPEHAPGLAPGHYVRLSVGGAAVTAGEPGPEACPGIAAARSFAERAGGGIRVDGELGRAGTVTLWIATALG